MNRPDLRLVAPACAVWAAVAGVPVVGARVALVAAAVLAVLALALLGGVRRSGAAAVALMAAAGCGVAAGRLVARASGPLPQLAREQRSVSLEAVLTADPQLARSGRIWVAPARADRLSVPGRSWRLRQPVLLLVRDPAWRALLPGQRVSLTGALRPPDVTDTVSAVVFVRGPPRDVRPASALGRLAGRARAGLRDAARGLPGNIPGLLPGLVDGDTSGLSVETQAEFRATGLTHLVAVSGANCVAVVAAVLGLTRLVRVGRRTSAVVAAVGLLGFVVMARPSPSVLRAAAMSLLGLVAIVAGRERPALPVLSATVLGLLLVDPDLGRQPGFALSVLATAGLLVLAPGWRIGLRARGWPPWLADVLAVAGAAQVACAPVLAVLAAGVSPASVPANVLAAPAVPWATIAGVLAAVVAPVAPPLAHAVAWAAAPPCWWLLLVAHVGSHVPGAVVSWPSGLGGGLLLALAIPVALALLRRRATRRRVG
jgi:competence protein ComEC